MYVESIRFAEKYGISINLGEAALMAEKSINRDKYYAENMYISIKYCIHVHFDNYKMVVKFKIAHRCDSVESLKSYSECLKDAVKFAKEVDKMMHGTR